MITMADAYESALGGDGYLFGIYNMPGIGGTDLCSHFAGLLSDAQMIERYKNSTQFQTRLIPKLSFLAPECYPANSYHFQWQDIKQYGLAKYAYDYSNLVARAALAVYKPELVMPVIKSTFEVKGWDPTANVTWPFMSWSEFR